MRTVVAAAAAVAAVVSAPAAHADDPTPAPSPGYQIPGPGGPTFPGAQVYPPICLAAPLACALRYDPSRGAWDAPPT
jgi:hypothetical protein